MSCDRTVKPPKQTAFQLFTMQGRVIGTRVKLQLPPAIQKKILWSKTWQLSPNYLPLPVKKVGSRTSSLTQKHFYLSPSTTGGGFSWMPPIVHVIENEKRKLAEKGGTRVARVEGKKNRKVQIKAT